MLKEFRMFFKYTLNFWRCWGKPHDWKPAGETLGGQWIRCGRCYTLDEYLPGLHEPEGYNPHG